MFAQVAPRPRTPNAWGTNELARRTPFSWRPAAQRHRTYGKAGLGVRAIDAAAGKPGHRSRVRWSTTDGHLAVGVHRYRGVRDTTGWASTALVSFGEYGRGQWGKRRNDLIDRRRLIIVTQVVMLVAAAALAVLAALSALTPALILVLLFVIGCGSAAGAATWQTLQPELVPPEIRTEAIALGSVNQNLARAVGPALGGLLLAGTSAALVFGVDAVSFVAVLFAVAATAIPRRPLPVPREHVVDAVRAGGRYVAYSPTLLSLIARTAAFISPAGAIWALLPLVARDKLALGSTGYGILLRCVGIGAFVAATLGLALRRRLSLRALYVLAGMIIAATAALLAVSTSSYLDASGLIVAGAAWITGLGLLGASYQEEMPPWVNARGISYYLVAFQGANALGGLGFGAVAQNTSLATVFFAITACLAAAVVATWRLAFPATSETDMQPGEPWPLPVLDPDLADSVGPVMVNVRWPVRHDATDGFLELAPELRRIRPWCHQLAALPRNRSPGRVRRVVHRRHLGRT